jgi:diketogulonate reductase-like aldo/keto reductase
MSVYNGSEMLEHSLAMTGQRYVDLALLHFPCSSWDDTLAMYRDLEAARDRGSQA